jgi:hypothetical protein
VNAENVDRAPFAPDVERRFRHGLPAVLVEQRDHVFHESGMPRIEQPVQTFALPQKPQVDASAQHRGDSA